MNLNTKSKNVKINYNLINSPGSYNTNTYTIYNKNELLDK